MYLYEHEFIAAVNRTYAAQLPVPVIQHYDERFLSDRGIDALYQLIPRHLGEIAEGEAIGKCIVFHTILLPYVRTLFGDSYLTIGYVQRGEQTGYKFTDDHLHTWLTHGLSSQERVEGVNFHVWITLPSMEIFDATSAFTGMLDTQSFVGGVVSTHPDDRQRRDGLEYHPIMVGSAFLQRIGAVSSFPWFEEIRLSAETSIERARRLYDDPTTPDVLLERVWIEAQAPYLYPSAYRNYLKTGRGLLIIEIGATPARQLETHPPLLGYPSLTELEQGYDSIPHRNEVLRRVRDYNPEQEFMMLVLTHKGTLGPFHVWKARRQVPVKILQPTHVGNV
ncbi:MAG: hypothetical protein H0T53_16010 [Herpetosiphonaceae bacterium]|nr:hypothetical protein [Herpetosiphonaceae bacterium]